MADVKWTKEQSDSIKIRNSKTLVAAGAGSGKTAVLVERIIRKIIDDGIDIDKMLIVTFTNAAASEMKERIRERLYQEASHNRDIQKQILYLNRSSIMTIDAFCKKAVKDYFYKLDIDPNFKIVDSTEAELLKLESIDEVLEEYYESNDENITDVLEAYSSNKSDEGLINLILSIQRFISSCPKPIEWLEEKCEMYNVHDEDFSKTLWGDMLIRYARKVIEEMVEELKNLEDMMINDPDTKNYLNVVQDDILQLEALRKNNFTWDDYYNVFSTIKFASLRQAPKMDEDLKEEVKSVRTKMKDIIEKDLRDNVFISSSSEIVSDLKIAYGHAIGIKELIIAFINRYDQKKAERNLLDFSDIEHLCLKLFETSEDVLKDYREKYQEILIDEYQDSNLIQETILNKISTGNMFMVGDVKQSIYKFRQARPELFLEKYNTYSHYIDDDKQELENKILLFKNFRSNENIVDDVNFIFKNIMHKDTAEFEYDEEEYLRFGASYYGYQGEPAELNIIEKKNDEEDESDLEDDIEEKLQLEARVVAKRIEELVGKFEVYDKHTKEKRKATYSDIAILLRATKGAADTFVQELGNRNIPVYADVKTGYFDNPEVQIMLSLLKIIDNPYQDIPLLSVLRSCIGSFDVNELTKIRLYERKAPFYEAMMIAATNGEEKVKAFLDKLNSRRDKSRYLSLNELITFLFEETGYYYYVSLLPNGERRQNNLKALLKKATDFEKSSFKGLYNFLSFIKNVKETSGDIDSPAELSETDDVVRIMSIHKSKGLEFPIVILSGMGRKFNKMDLQKQIVCHQDLGFGFDIVDSKHRVTYESIPKQALKLQCKKELLAEEMRILYVAMTRAKEKLIITTLAQNIEKRIDEWSSKITNYKISSASSFADWICNVVLSTDNNWIVNKWSYNDVLSLSNTEEGAPEENVIYDKYSEEDYTFINNRMNYKYPYSLATKIPSKLSVSELKRLHNFDDLVNTQKVKAVDTPNFIEEAKISGATYGSLLHSKMEKIDYSNFDVENLLQDIEDEKTKKRLEKDLTKFSKSKIYEIILSANRIHREVPFNLELSAKDVFNILDSTVEDEEIMIQGIIDLYCETEKGLILIDYKSDRLKSENGFIERYKKQLEYYKKALERITGQNVVETYIYSFELEKEIYIV